MSIDFGLAFGDGEIWPLGLEGVSFGRGGDPEVDVCAELVFFLRREGERTLNALVGVPSAEPDGFIGGGLVQSVGSPEPSAYLWRLISVRMCNKRNGSGLLIIRCSCVIKRQEHILDHPIQLILPYFFICGVVLEGLSRLLSSCSGF